MFGNKKIINPHPSKLEKNVRATTPKHQQKQKQRVSQSQTKTQKQISQPLSKLFLIKEKQTFAFPYYLGKGNNHELIKCMLERREGWGEIQNNIDYACFRWVQNSNFLKYHSLGKTSSCFNHFEFHRQLSNKQRLVKNLINFCQVNKINVYSFIPVTFILNLNTNDEDLALHSFIKFFHRNHPDESVTNKRKSIIVPRNKFIPYFSPQQLNKKCQGNFYCKLYCPKTFIDSDICSYLWVLKPTFLNRGRGVVLFKELEELQKLIWKYYDGEGLEDYSEKYNKNMENSISKKQIEQQKEQEEGEKVKQKEEEQRKMKDSKETNDEEIKKQVVKNSQDELKNRINAYNSKCTSFVIQKYIEKPMLINGKKFDIRFFALLTHNLQVYTVDEGYLRFSSQIYSTNGNHTNPFIHLTNNSVQKYSKDYNLQSGNQDTLSSIKVCLPQNKADSIYKEIMQKIKEIVWISMCAGRRKINVNSRKWCFELFGYDFMIDCQYNVWLIQINTNPSLDEQSPLLSQLMPRMIDDMFKLTIDKIFKSSMKENNQGLKVDGIEDDVNIWEFLGDLREGWQKKKVNTRKNSINTQISA